MVNWNNYDMIEIIEAFAADNGWISSEEELSELFDSDVAPMVIETYGTDDSVAMREAFSDWTDTLCKDGVIHELQYNTYCYVGEYSE